MNSSSIVSRIIPAMEVTEGAGVTVHRSIGNPSLRNYDPFMLLDHMSSEDPDDYIAGFPSHPHRGFNTFTYIIDGDMEHKDSMGNTGNLGPGGAQWMKAASGVIHSEMPKQIKGLLRGFQLWINLPAANKMDSPEYQEYQSTAFPVVEHGDYNLRVIIGHFGEAISPIRDELTKVSYFDVQLKPAKHFQINLPKNYHSFLYLFEGDGHLSQPANGQYVSHHCLATLDDRNAPLEFIAGKQGARFLLVGGKPIHEPIAQYGPFVMNSREEIDQAMKDFQLNNFVRDRARIKRNL